MTREEIIDLATDEYAFACDGQKPADRAAAVCLRADALESSAERELRAMGWTAYTQDDRREVAKEMRRMAQFETGE